jgi:two-component sensor histidine kinase
MSHRPTSGNTFVDLRRSFFYKRPAYALQGAGVFSPRQLFAIFLALVVCGMAFWLRLAIDGVLPPGFPYVTFFPAIIFTTFVLGMWPGIACALMGGILSLYYLLPTSNGLEMSPSTWVAIGFYLFISVAFILMLTLMDSAIRKADIAQKQAEANSEFQSIMAREMNHRVKNLFGVITSIVRLTAKSSTDMNSFATQLAGRISSLSHAHEIVWESAGETSVSLHEVIERILAPHRTQLSAEVNVSISGDCRVDDPHIQQVVSLLINELATNASKYGVFSKADGSLKLRIEEIPTSPEADRRLVLYWHERFGSTKPIADNAEIGKGFGTELMERLVSGVDGTYAHDIKSGEGVDATIELPLGKQPHLE